jgi:hypothetical protein
MTAKLICITIFLFVGTTMCFSQKKIGKATKTVVKTDSIKKEVTADSIQTTINLSSKKDSAKINEIIAIRLNTTKPISFFTNLYVDGLKVPELKPWKSNDRDKTVLFKLDHNVQDLVLEFLESKAIDKAIVPLYFSVGDSVEYVSKGIVPVYLEVKQKISRIWVWVIAALLTVFLIIALTQNVLKDDNNLYYSLSRTQLLFWTILFSVAYLYLCMQTGALPDIPGSLLAIMGITAATTAVSKVIENNHKQEAPIDPNAKSEGFFLDILSDGSSINIQRFQNVMFNLLFGVIFIQKTLSTNLMPDFDSNVLLMLGISSGTYAGLKITEATKELDKPAPQVNSDTSETEAKSK